MFEGAAHVPEGQFDTASTPPGGDNNGWTRNDANHAA